MRGNLHIQFLNGEILLDWILSLVAELLI